MNVNKYAHFSIKLSKYAPKDRERFIDYEINKLEYDMKRISIIYPSGKEEWRIEVWRKDQLLFDDRTQRFTFKQAIDHSRRIALEHYELHKNVLIS